MDIDIKEYYKNYYRENKEHMQELFKKRREEKLGNYIYLLTNCTGKIIYVGSTVDICSRINHHLNGFTHNTREYRENIYKVFVATIKEDISRKELYFIEQHFIDKFKNTLINCRDSYSEKHIEREEYLINIIRNIKFKLYKLDKENVEEEIEMEVVEGRENVYIPLFNELVDKYKQYCYDYLDALESLEDKNNITIEEFVKLQKLDIAIKTEEKTIYWFIDKMKQDNKRFVYV